MLSEMYIETKNFKKALKHANIAYQINPNHKAPKQLLDILNTIN